MPRETAKCMAAMARMYELTHDTRYLNHLREFIEDALDYRFNPSNPRQA